MAQVLTLAQAVKHIDILQADVRAAAHRGLVAAAMRGVQTIKTEIIPSRTPQPVDRGLYRAGWKARKTAEGAEILNEEPHAAFIDNGVRAENVKAGRALIEALTEWVKRKGLVKAYKGKNPAKAKASNAAIKSLVWAIIIRMQKRGIHNRGDIPGLGILKELVEKRLPAFVTEEVERELARLT